MLCWSSKIWPKCHGLTFSIIWWWSPHREWHSFLVSWASIHKIFPCFNPSFTKFAKYSRSRHVKCSSCFNLWLEGGKSELTYWFASTVGYVRIHVPRSLYSERFMNALCSRPSLGKESPSAWSKSFGYGAVIVLVTIPGSVHHFGEVYNIERVASSRC